VARDRMGDSSGDQNRRPRDGVIAALDSPRRLDYECATIMWPTGYFTLFAVLTIIGGCIGYAKADSVISMIAGLITGFLLLAAGWLVLQGPLGRNIGFPIALAVSVLLAARFVPQLIRTGKIMPAGMMSILSVIGIVVAIVAWLKK